MSSKKNEIIQSLFSFYKQMYDSKDLFNKSYFKYSPDQVFKELKNELTNVSIDNLKNTEVSKNLILREEIASLKDEKDVKHYFKNNAFYSSDETDIRENILKNFSTEELKYIYNILYSSPLRSKVRKTDILIAIEKYFDSMDRVRSMKP